MYKDTPIRSDGYSRKVFVYQDKKYVLVTYKGDDQKIDVGIFHTNGRRVSPELQAQILGSMKEAIENIKAIINKVVKGDQ